jgi:hypothetical protein
MPDARFALLLAAVILAAALTVWIASLAGGAGAAAWLLPVLMAAALALRALGRR